MRTGYFPVVGGDGVRVVKVDLHTTERAAGAALQQMKFSETKLFHVPIVAKRHTNANCMLLQRRDFAV